jgi:hypothetical protein
LFETRQLIENIEEQRTRNRQWLKTRRTHVDHSGCEHLVQQFHVDRSIAESLAGSLAKSEGLSYVRAANVFEVLEDNFFGEQSRFLVSLDGTDCSCGKLATVGLPCSHIFRILSEINQMEKVRELIHPRWVLNDEEYCVAQTEQILTRLETLPKDLLSADLTVRQRFASSLANSQEAASVACKTQEAYEAFVAMLKQFIQDHMKPVGPKQGQVRDLGGIRAGRKPLKRAQQVSSCASKKTCAICGNPHPEVKCPHLNDVKRYVRESDRPDQTSPTGKHCSICGFSGHYAPRCPAIQRYLAYFNIASSDDDTPPMPEDNVAYTTDRDEIHSETEDPEMDEFSQSDYYIDDEDVTDPDSESNKAWEEEEDRPDLSELSRKLERARSKIMYIQEKDRSDREALRRTVPPISHD